MENHNPRWRYESATGHVVEGVYLRSFDYGGTDVTYQFRRDDGTVDMVSGQRLKRAVVLPPTKEN